MRGTIFPNTLPPIGYSDKFFIFASNPYPLSPYRMKKALKLIGSFIAGAGIGVIGACVGIYFVSGMSFETFGEKIAAVNGLEAAGIAGVIIVSLLLSFFLQVILHEGGHLVCGLATGYRFVSFRILHLTIIRHDGRLCIKRFAIAGTEGQCLLTPPDKPLQEIPCVLYNLGGVLSNLLTAAIAIILIIAVDGMPYPLEIFLLVFAFVGILLGLMNGIPMKIGGIGNDADNMRLLLKDKNSKQAMVTQLRVNALVQKGVRPKEMPEEWFRLEGETDYKNALQTTIRLMHIGRLQDREEWEAAYHELEEMMSHKEEVIGLFAKEMECELLCTALVTRRTERAEEIYTDKLAAYIRQYKDVMSSKQRILCVSALYREKDAAKAKEIYTAVCLRKDKYLMQGEVRSDIALMKSILAAENVL